MPKQIHVALFFKDFAAWIKSSCVGLNVAGFTTAQVLRADGFDVSVYPVRHNVDIVHALDAYNETHGERITHAIISAPWLSTHDLRRLLENFSDIQFVILSHSNVGFLQADSGGVRLLREYVALAQQYGNLRIGGNSRHFTDWFKHAYSYDAVLLPNLYPVTKVPGKKWDGNGPLQIGVFGAARPYKNFMTAVGAAVIIHNMLGVDVQVHMSCGGEDDHFGIARAIDEMCSGLPGVQVIRHPWRYWTDFIETVSKMDLLIQVSYTESFNMVTADGISVGAPSVVSPAITWAPDNWKAEPDCVLDVAQTGLRLLRGTGWAGANALAKHNTSSLGLWRRFLTGKKPGWFSRLCS